MPITEHGLKVFNKNWKKMFVGEGCDIILMTEIDKIDSKWYEKMYRILFNKPRVIFRHFDFETGKLLNCYEEVPEYRIKFTDADTYEIPVKKDSPVIYVAAIVDKDDNVLAFFKFVNPQTGMIGYYFFLHDFEIYFNP